jgi:riboflavin kinase/FMN adenylyltransferase
MRIITLGTDTNHCYFQPMCACIGYFDGMHLGHQALIRKTLELSEKYHCESAMITFEPDPWVTLKGMKNVHHISTMRERMNRAIELGIDNIVILEFTKQLADYEPEDFVHLIQRHLNLKAIVCGFDYHYGKQGKGNPESLRKTSDIETVVVDPVEDAKGKISSTRIEDCIKNGRMEEASKLLGIPFSISGKVIPGNQKGSTLGYPTANLAYSDEYILPKQGVYAGYVIANRQKYRAMINFGHNPTLNFRQNLSLEVHIMNCDLDLYGRILRVEFIKFMRDEKKFNSRNNLILQLDQDSRNINRTLDAYE